MRGTWGYSVCREWAVFRSEYPEQHGFQSASVLTSVSLLFCWVVSRRRLRGIRFRCVAHYVKVVATPEGLGVIWTPSLFREVLSLFIPFLWSLAACGCHGLCVLYTKKGFERTAVRIGKVKTSAAERRKKSTLGLTRGCMPSHIAQEAVTVRLGRVDGLSKADVLLCPIRLMYVSSEETTVLRSHIAPPPHPHHHLLFLCLGACLLNPASGKWPGPSIHTVHIRACSGFMAQT